MGRHVTFGRRGMIAAAAGAAAGAIIRPQSPPAFAASGGGDQQPLVLGSNPVRTAGSSANTSNISSVTTTVEASPNFANFVSNTTSSVFQADARPAVFGQIIGIEAFGRGSGDGLVATGGTSSISVGVTATGSSTGVVGQGANAGLIGTATSSGQNSGIIGVGGTAGYGALVQGGRAPLLLYPSANPGPPTLSEHSIGELMVDSAGKLFYCRVGGNPGTWIELSAQAPVFNTLPAPERFVDTRSGLGGVKGPLPAGSTRTFQISGRIGQSNNAALQIPDNATTLVGNLTVLGGPEISVGSFVTLWPGGALPTVSNVNVGPGGVIANSFVVGTVANTGHRSLNVFNSQQCDYILDVTAYYT